MDMPDWWFRLKRNRHKAKGKDLVRMLAIEGALAEYGKDTSKWPPEVAKRLKVK